MSRSAITVLGMAILIFMSGSFGYALAASRYAMHLADLKANIARAQSAQSARVLKAERAAADLKSNMEAIRAAWEQTRHEAGNETARLGRELSNALQQLRQSAPNRGAGSLPQSTKSTCDCADLRETNARLAGAVERLVAGGARIVADGQTAANVAGIAAEWARQAGGGR